MSTYSHKQYDALESSQYLKDVYSTFDAEERASLVILHNIYSLIKPQKRLLEVGGGPTIYQLISAASKVQEIFFSEYSSEFRKEIERWVHADPQAWDWNTYVSYICKLEGRAQTPESIDHLTNRLRSKIVSVLPCNVFTSNMLEPYSYPPFDVVSVHYCPESITDNERQFQLAMKHIAMALRSGGHLVMGLLKNSPYYLIDGKKTPTFPVDEVYIKKTLQNLGFTIECLETIPVSPSAQSPYEGDIYLLAKNLNT